MLVNASANVLARLATVSDMPVNELFARNLALVIEHRGLNPTAAAAAWRIPQRTIQAIITNERRPSLETATLIAERAGYKLWQLTMQGFDPASPPLMQPMTPKQKEAWESFLKLHEALT